MNHFSVILLTFFNCLSQFCCIGISFVRLKRAGFFYYFFQFSAYLTFRKLIQFIAFRNHIQHCLSDGIYICALIRLSVAILFRSRSSSGAYYESISLTVFFITAHGSEINKYSFSGGSNNNIFRFDVTMNHRIF